MNHTMIFTWCLVGWLEFNVPCQHKYGHNRDGVLTWEDGELFIDPLTVQWKYTGCETLGKKSTVYQCKLYVRRAWHAVFHSLFKFYVIFVLILLHEILQRLLVFWQLCSLRHQRNTIILLSAKNWQIGRSAACFQWRRSLRMHPFIHPRGILLHRRTV